jgi:hypothetical protein
MKKERKRMKIKRIEFEAIEKINHQVQEVHNAINEIMATEPQDAELSLSIPKGDKGGNPILVDTYFLDSKEYFMSDEARRKLSNIKPEIDFLNERMQEIISLTLIPEKEVSG